MTPHLPDGEHRVSLACPYPNCKAKLTWVVHGPEGAVHFGTCGVCGRELVVDMEFETWRVATFLTFTALLVAAVPIMLVDRTVWAGLNSLSEFLQRVFGVSKYQLAAGAFAAGCLSFPFLEIAWWPGAIDTLVWGLISFPYFRWCVRKAREGDEESEILRFDDEQMIRWSRLRRVVLGGPALLVGILLLKATGSLWLLGMALINVGYYWMDSNYIPPSKRRLFDIARSFAFGDT